jgi:rubrerythrin
VISPLLEIAANTRGLKGISFTDLSTRPTHQSAYSHSDHNLDVDANTPDFGWKSCKKCKSHMLIEPKNGKCPICNTLVHENSSSESTVVI